LLSPATCRRAGYADFLDYFQHEPNTGTPKGIAAINLEDLR
jgi:hypothetical protein